MKTKNFWLEKRKRNFQKRFSSASGGKVWTKILLIIRNFVHFLIKIIKTEVKPSLLKIYFIGFWFFKQIKEFLEQKLQKWFKNSCRQ